MAYDKQALADLVRREAVAFGDFTLASGAKSSYYIDCRKVTLSAAGAALIGAGVLELLRDGPAIDAVGGMSIGADPILAAALTLAGLEGRPLRGFIVRKEAKGHGMGKQVEGPIQPGDRCVIVEDVVTTGGSSFKAIDAVEATGAKVVRVIAVLDRLAGGAETFAAKGIPFQSLLTLKDLGL